MIDFSKQFSSIIRPLGNLIYLNYDFFDLNNLYESNKSSDS